MKAPRTRPLLVEIGCEEIPARFLDGAREDFGRRLVEALQEARLLPAEMKPPRCYSTPRRLVVWVPEVLLRQVDLVEEVVGPPVKVAFDAAGKPTRAAESFAAKNAVEVTQLARVTTPKGEYVAVRKTLRGKPARRLLPAILPGVITGLSFPKSMYWVAKAGPRFVRPIRWLLALLGEGAEASVIPFEIAGVESADFTYGHRALRPKAVHVRGFEDYAKKLRRAFVEFDQEVRRPTVHKEAQVLLEEPLRLVEDQELVQWIANSTEWPSGIRGSFDERFLHLPREILTTVMRDHQKYFSVENTQGNLEPFFVAILNMDEDARGLIRKGHERVLAARFADAEFFWNSDQKVPLADRAERLASVTYQAELGSYADKVERMRQIARLIVQTLADQDKITHAEAGDALRAVDLSKCDLTTQMVQEFTELQGVVGGLYAAAQGEPQGVADAIYDHYKPAGLEDSAPRSLAGAVVSLADKLDSVVGGFAVGQEPTGSSDPFALRRQGNGIVKVLVEGSLPIDLRPLVEQALNSLTIEWPKPQAEVFSAVLSFLAERLRFYLETARGLRYDTVRAALAAGSDVPAEAAKRAEALEKLRASADLDALVAAAKRTRNILGKSASSGDWKPGDVESDLLKQDEELFLYHEFLHIQGLVEGCCKEGAYETALRQIAKLRRHVDSFFDKVLVMAEDMAIRQNRLRLLGKLDGLFSGIAHFAELASGSTHVDAPTTLKVKDEW